MVEGVGCLRVYDVSVLMLIGESEWSVLNYTLQFSLERGS